jgi:hypothetical protein
MRQYLPAVSVSTSVLRRTLTVSLSLIRCQKSAQFVQKSAQFVCLIHRHGYFSWFSVCGNSVTRTG